MAPRSSWKGFLRLSLVSVPVKAYSATNSSEEIRLNQLHKECHSRVRYQKVCPEHGELKSDDITTGYEYAKDQYVLVDPEEVQKLRAQSDKTIGIDGFVPPDAIDPKYLGGRTYYLAPDGVAGKKPFALLHRGMEDAEVAALATIVLGGREQLVLIRPTENVFTMSVLTYARKVKPLDEFTPLQEPQELTDDELALARTLIAASTKDDLDFAAYEDRYVANLQQIIRAKVEGEEIVEAKDHEEPKILNLMDALKKSVAEAQAARATETPARKKKQKKATKRKAAPSAKAGKKAPSRRATKKKSG
ncbi:MAG: Ku protein [Planctomycetota bacterium JB042]